MKDYWHLHRKRETRRYQLLASVLIIAAFAGGVAVGSQLGAAPATEGDEQYTPSEVHKKTISS
jgi:hypothetical protein